MPTSSWELGDTIFLVYTMRHSQEQQEAVEHYFSLFSPSTSVSSIFKIFDVEETSQTASILNLRTVQIFSDIPVLLLQPFLLISRIDN
jgi:hypothetical protein